MTALWNQLRRRRAPVVALGVLGVLAAGAVFADLIASDLPMAVRLDGKTYWFPNLVTPVALRGETNQSLQQRLVPARGDWLLEPPLPYGRRPRSEPERAGVPPFAPDWQHLLGTDEVGRDVLALILHGARVSLSVGLWAVALYVVVGALLGALAGYYGGWVDLLVSRATEVMMTFPTFFFVLALLALVRVQTVIPVIAVIALTQWTEVARLVRAEVLRLKAQEFVQASRALGASDARILLRHLLPNATGPVLVTATFGVAGAILIESGLSFLGVLPSTASWGELLGQGQRYIVHPSAWWLTVFPGMAIFATVFSLNVIGEALREALDPRLRGR